MPSASSSSHIDGLDDMMELEKGFYDEGYKAGVEDGTEAGLIEGKIFGIEKGYEKALEMGKLHGRAMVWNARLHDLPQTEAPNPSTAVGTHDITNVAASLSRLPNSDRLRKQVESLMKLVDSASLDVTNSDQAVAIFDDLMVKARSRAKVVSNMTGEALSTSAGDSAANVGIEDARGLSARH